MATSSASGGLSKPTTTFPDFSPRSVFATDQPRVQPSRPEDCLTPQEIQAKLVEEMNEMSPEEREEILSEIHGITKPTEETDELLEFSLLRVQQIVDQLLLRSKWDDGLKNDVEAYSMADPNFVENRDFRLMFLRRDRFDPVIAANRMMLHMSAKLDLFGEEKLSTEITMDSLDEADLEALESRCFSSLPLRDASSRAIFWFEPARRGFHTARTLKRAYWFIAMRLLKEIPTQTHGFTSIITNLSQDRLDYVTLIDCFAALGNAIPIRAVSNHFCAPSIDALSFLAYAQYYSLKNCRTRCRSHIGTTAQNYEALKSFGIFIPSFVMPYSVEASLVSKGSSICSTSHLDSKVKLLDRSSTTRLSPGRIVQKPEQFDVCFGKGKSRHHSGNLHAQKLVDGLYDQYHSTSRKEKTRIVHRVLSVIHKAGGRFLRPAMDVLGDEGIGMGFVVVNDVVAREKLGKFFRKRSKQAVCKR